MFPSKALSFIVFISKSAFFINVAFSTISVNQSLLN
jgi:hypothetical protein